MTHRIEWTIEAGCPPRATFSCDALPEARCRSWCSEESCRDEEFCSSPPGPNHNPEEDGPPHRWADTGRCYVVEYLQNAGTADELYAGEEAPLRSGPISTSWEGDGYEWEYAAPVVDRRDLRADLERIAMPYVAPEERGSVGLQRQAHEQAERLVAVMLPLVDAYAWRNP